MNEIEIFNETNDDFSMYYNDIKNCINKGLELENVNNGVLNIIFVDSDYIRYLNKTYRKYDRETDVISFALEESDNKAEEVLNKRLLGDIYICTSKARSQAEEYGHSLKREVCFLSVHGLFHLLGYDHMTKDEESIMFGKQEEVLNALEIVR